jgi:hypothetical protein
MAVEILADFFDWMGFCAKRRFVAIPVRSFDFALHYSETSGCHSERSDAAGGTESKNLFLYPADLSPSRAGRQGERMNDNSIARV